MDARKIIPHLFRANDHWFYSFTYRWVHYHSNQGYKTHIEAEKAALEHIAKVTK